jgi:hypothetical protein
MNYAVGVGSVLLAQLAISYAIILATTGGGSFVALGAMLFAVYGIPATAIANFALVRRHRKNPQRSNVVLLILISCVLPIVQLALLIAQMAFNL